MSNINKTNIKNFFLGLGSSDAKTNVATLTELENQIIALGEFYQDNDIVWVVAEKAFYTINKSTNPPYEVYETGGGATIVGNTANIYYGKEDDILDFLRGVTSKAPGELGYNDGDGFISSRTVSSGAIVITKFDVYEANIPSGQPGTYDFIGSIKGADGADGADGVDGNTGPQGAQGEKGDPFVVDEQGLFVDRDVNCAAKPVGYSFLATDEGLLYFKEADPCVWSAGIPFGKGDPGETQFYSYVRATELAPPTKPVTDELHPGAGWFDVPPPATGNPDDRLWMTTTRYSNATATWTWTDPVIIDGKAGENGGDGADGKGGGTWTIWSDEEDPGFTGINKPVVELNGDYTLDISSTPNWYDNVAPGQQPIWMAQSLLNSNTNVWADWQFVKAAGEKPPYMIDLYNRAETQPPNVTTDIPYYTGQALTTGAQAAVLVNADGNSGWTDTPQPGTGRLWMIKLYLDNSTLPNNAWSIPVDIDGEEGKSAGFWMVWSDNDTSNKPVAPPPPSPVDGSIDLTGTDWYDDVIPNTNTPVWSASTYYNVGDDTWTTWRIAQVKGNDGLDATDLTEYTVFRTASISGAATVPILYTTLQEALEDADEKNQSGGFDFELELYQDGSNNTAYAIPTVGSRTYQDNLGDDPFYNSNEKYFLITDASKLAIYVIKTDYSGYVLSVASLADAYAMLPAAILNYQEVIFPTFITTGTYQFVDVPFWPPKLVTACIECTSEVTLGSKIYSVGERVTIPFQNESENNDLRSLQIAWRQPTPGDDTYIVDIRCTTIKVFGFSTSSGQNGYNISEANWKLIVQIYS